MKKIIKFLVIFLLLAGLAIPAYAKGKASTHISKAEKYIKKNQTSKAIEEYTRALKIEPENIDIKIDLLKTYAARVTKYIKQDKEYGKAANDIRSSLFYILYFNPELNTEELNNINEVEKALLFCNKRIGINNSAKTHFYIAQLLDIAEEYPAAGYEYMEAARNKKYRETSIKRTAEILILLGGKK